MSNPLLTGAADSFDKVRLTPLGAALQIRAEKQGFEDGEFTVSEFAVHGAVRTPRVFDDPSQEIDSLFFSAGILDLGWRGKILVTGNDRLRWLNGMVTNAVQALPQDEGNYSFALNAQGRIQGDCYVYRRAGDLILDSSRDQIPALLRHFEHYIIMDEVELQDVSGQWTGLAVVGPQAPKILASLGIGLPSAAAHAHHARFGLGNIQGVEIIVVEADPVLVPRYEIWLAPADVLRVWNALKAAGAKPAGLAAAETLRVLEGTPLYGIDLSDRDLPQETRQTRALNFNKGCYLGQEIVERIHSRGKLHREFRQFALDGLPGSLPLELRSAGQVAGHITSAASVSNAGLRGNFALGFVREEILMSKAPIEYDGGSATPLDGLPQLKA
jgi:folate-binding protein YgfZ